MSTVQATAATHLSEQKAHNKEKTVALSTALNSKFADLQKQNNRLQYVKSELNQLDKDLMGNILILRAEIEKVGKAEWDALARFKALEEQYAAAKKDKDTLQKRKSLLVQHLDYLIITNEKNKAAKLAQLEAELTAMDQAEQAPQQNATEQVPQKSKGWTGFADDQLE
jgi:hypothetical protein